MDMTANIARNSIFGPAPFHHCSRVKLQLARWCWKTLVCFAIDHHADGDAIACDSAAHLIYLNSFQVGRFQLTFIEGEDGSLFLGYLKGSILLHVFQWR